MLFTHPAVHSIVVDHEMQCQILSRRPRTCLAALTCITHSRLSTTAPMCCICVLAAAVCMCVLQHCCLCGMIVCHPDCSCYTVQVEHPVTEWISGVNIPSCQVMIGMGIRLERMPDIRRLFGRDPYGSDSIGMLSLLLQTTVQAYFTCSPQALHNVIYTAVSASEVSQT